MSLERGVRQMLADKVSGNLSGIWLLVAEHLRLGTWDLLRGWTGHSAERIEPRLAMQMVSEAAVCTTGIRSQRTLHGRSGFELANGLPFVATDTAMHALLDSRDIAGTQRLQVALGQLRRSLGHFRGRLLAIDPHRVRSHSRRNMRLRSERGGRPMKQSQMFWLLDADTHQPICFTTATASASVVDATAGLLSIGAEILGTLPKKPLVVADCEHLSSDLFHDIASQSSFDLLVPFPGQSSHRRRWSQIDAEDFTPRWAGYATTKRPYQVTYGSPGEYFEFVQRTGELPAAYKYKGFLSTSDADEVESLTNDFPKRWHIEEFFNAYQDLGWNRAGTQNLNIRYGQMTMALLAQAASHQLRTRLGAPVANWNANQLAKNLLFRLEGDVRVTHDTIVVTYYNPPNADQLRKHYEGLPDRLASDGIASEVPWLYGYKLDFRFR